jgi:hypothetical protein
MLRKRGKRDRSLFLRKGLAHLIGDRTKFQSKESLQWLESLLYAIDVAKESIEQLIVSRIIRPCNRCNATIVGRKGIRPIHVMNRSSNLNTKKGIQDFSIRI